MALNPGHIPRAYKLNHHNSSFIFNGNHTQLLLHRVSAAYRHTFTDLVVSEHSAELRTPVDHRVAEICQTVIHQHIALLAFVHGPPLVSRQSQILGSGSMESVCPVSFKMLDELRHRHGLCGIGVIVMVEHLDESH